MFVSAFFMCIQIFLPVCFTYNIEIRMYSMANLFVFLCFWYGIELIEEHTGKKNWILFTFSGVLAAYTHYYALISVAYIYIVVYCVLAYRNKKNIYKCVLSAITCVVAYLPWLMKFMQTFGRVSSGWWSKSIPKIQDCFEFIVGDALFSKYVLLILVVSIAILLINAMKQYKFVVWSDVLHVDMLFVKKFFFSMQTVKVWVAVFAILGTIGTGIGISHIIRPLFLTRYIYAVVGILALVISIYIGKVFQKTRMGCLILVIAVVLGSSNYMISVKTEKEANKATCETVQYINMLYEEGDQVVCNVSHMNWTVLDSYFDFPHSVYEGYSENYAGKTTWLFYSGTLEEEFVKEIENSNGMLEHVKCVRLARYGFDIYKISYKGEDIQ